MRKLLQKNVGRKVFGVLWHMKCRFWNHMPEHIKNRTLLNAELGGVGRSVLMRGEVSERMWQKMTEERKLKRAVKVNRA